MKNILVIYCYVANYSPNISGLYQQTLSHIISVDLEFRRSLAEWFWLGISHEVTATVSAGVAFIWGLDWGVKMCSQGSLIMWLAVLPLPPHVGYSIDQLVSPRLSDTRERQKPDGFYGLTLEVTLYHFCNIFLDTQVSPNQCGRELCECVTTRR